MLWTIFHLVTWVVIVAIHMTRVGIVIVRVEVTVRFIGCAAIVVAR